MMESLPLTSSTMNAKPWARVEMPRRLLAWHFGCGTLFLDGSNKVELRSTGGRGLMPLRGSCIPREQFGGHEIFQSAAHTLEQRDVLDTRSSALLPAGEFMKIASDMSGPDQPFLHRNQQVTRPHGRALVAFHENTRALHGSGVHLARVRLKSAHQIQVDAGPQQIAVEQRRLGRSTSAEHIGFSSAGSRVCSYGSKSCCCGHSLCKVSAR